MEHVQSKLDQAEVADILRTSRSQKVAGSAGLSWTPVFVPSFYFLGATLMQHNRSNKLHCHLMQWRRHHNTLSYCICCVKNSQWVHTNAEVNCNFPEVSDLCNFEKTHTRMTKNMCLIKRRNVHPSMGRGVGGRGVGV